MARFTRLRRTVLTAATVLLAASATNAHASPPPSPKPVQANTYQFVDADSVPSDQLEHLATPQSLADYQRSRSEPGTPRTKRSVTAAADEADLRTDCAREGNAAAAKSTTGWIKSRFETCMHRPYDLVLRSTDGRETIGRLWFDAWILGFAYDGDRRVDYLTSIEDIRVQTAGSEDATKWRIRQQFSHTVDPSNSDPDPKVTGPQQNDRDGLLGEWNTQPLWTLKYTSPDKGPLYSQGNQQRVSALTLASLSVSSPSSSLTFQDVDAFRSNFRFDYAGPVAGKYKGTVFTEARMTFRPRLDDPLGWETARHIYDALRHPERTFPATYPKVIPGEKEPLHRVLDQDTVDKNRKAANDTCVDVWGPYDGTKLNCDEYPFASTYEGAAKGDKRYSARLIDADDNQKVGRELNSQFYTVNRVLDNDAFYVAVDGDPSLPPPQEPDPSPQPRSNDMNGDGKADLIAVDSAGKLYFYPGGGDGTLGSRLTIGTGGWSGASISHRGDWTGDGKEDIVARVGGEIRIYPGRGDGTIGSPSGLNGALGNTLPNTAQLVSVGDLTGDDYPDLVANYNGNLWLYAGDPAKKPGVKAATKVGSGWSPYTLTAPGDTTGSKTADLLARNTSDGKLWRYRGAANTFGNRTLYGAGGWTTTNRPLIASGDDADNNGLPDLWATASDGKLLFYRGARDADGNPVDGPSVIVGTGGWSSITTIS
ncbi:FG-GAP-like repeat-containing protein [Streptomyces sp. NPDC088757]|uniref:FG-GAP-like repeat-containing protein n=1 Tax=Streptomyces sp. NPDC088757 TaxID=3365889 RepID=UPI0037F56CE8